MHGLLEKWISLHWFCTLCEPVTLQAIKHIKAHPINALRQDALPQTESKIEKLVSDLEVQVKAVLVRNDEITKSYAEVVKSIQSGHLQTQPTIATCQTASTEKNAVNILDVCTDRKCRKANIMIHNVKESTQDDREARQAEDCMVVTEILNQGLNITDVSITKAIRIGGRGQNRGIKPRLILATLDTTRYKRDILSNARKLRNTPQWDNIHISSDQTPKEREESKALRDLLKQRREAGESNLVIRNGKIITLTPRNSANDNQQARRESHEVAAMAVTATADGHP